MRGRREAGIDLLSPSDLKAIYEGQARKGQRLPIAFVLGAHPVDHISANLRVPVDEVGIMASLRDGPMPMVKCVTNESKTAANAAIV